MTVMMAVLSAGSEKWLETVNAQLPFMAYQPAN